MTTLTLYHGDCLEVLKDISANSIDLIICDLPYGCLTNQTGESTGFTRPSHKGTNLERKLGLLSDTGCAWDIKINLEKFWEQVKRVLKNDNSPVIHFCTTKFGYELIQSNPDWFRYELVWDKQRGVSFLLANKMPMRSHEMIYVFAKKGAFYTRVDIEGDFPAWKVKREGQTAHTYGEAKKTDSEGVAGKRCVKSIVQINGHLSRHKNQHPTEKPSELYRWLIERYCPPGGTVLDPTFGSGNSVFTAYDLNRNAIGIEKDDAFYKKASDRMDAL